MKGQRLLIVLMVLTALIGFNLVGRSFTGLAVSDSAGEYMVKSNSVLLIFGAMMLGATIMVLSSYLRKRKEETEKKEEN
ncbi:hypothetical protein JXA85_02070 [Candidatus Woesearchaeota archaeon]|nr:hypothetical protein [Candidatus Woesearchaeota archaeon]